MEAFRFLDIRDIVALALSMECETAGKLGATIADKNLVAGSVIILYSSLKNEE